MLSQIYTSGGDQGTNDESPESRPATLSEVLGHAQAQAQRPRRASAWSGDARRKDQRKRSTKIASRTLRQAASDVVVEHGGQRTTNAQLLESVIDTAGHQLVRQVGFQESPRPTRMGSLEPFDAFPVKVNNTFLDIFDRYYRGYRWEPSKRKLLAETASNTLLGHSFLAIAHNVYHPNQYEALNHETQTIQVISQALRSSKASSTASTNVPLTWAISRLAMIRAQQGDWETALRHMNACVMTCGPLQSVVNHKFGTHLLCTFMVVLLSNFVVTRSVVPSLWKPYGDPPRSILAEVESLGFKLPLASLMSLRGQDMDPELRDILCALSALCFPVPCTTESHATHLVRQGIEMLKIGLWLAELSPLNHCGLGDADSPEWQNKLQECLRWAALLFVLSPSPVSRDATRQLRRTLTPELLFWATGSQGQVKTAAATLPFWILLVCGATAHDTSDQMHFAKLIMKFYPGFLDHAISGPEVPFSRLSGKFLPPTLDCLVAGVHYLNSANGWPFSAEKSSERDQSAKASMSTSTESEGKHTRPRDLQKWGRSSIGTDSESSAKYFLDLYIQLTECGPDRQASEKASGIEVSVTAEDEQQSSAAHCEDGLGRFSIDDEFLSF